MIYLACVSFVAAIVMYISIAVIVHGLFERRSLKKYGFTIKEMMNKVDVNNKKEWDAAFNAKEFAIMVAIFWIFTPLLYILRFCIRMGSKAVPAFEKLHAYVKLTGLDSTGASSVDLISDGAYRSKPLRKTK